MTKTRFALAAFSTASALAICAPAFAQTTGTSSPTEGPAQNVPPGTSATASARNAPQTVGEIVVTAQKRTQSVQDVPLAVTVVGSEQLARQNIQNVTQLPNAVPALEVPNLPGQGASPSIRGIGTSAVSATSENAVALVLDGVVLGRAPVNSLFDISRVEVLRGPQGMLFGKNASAGVLNITTNAPDPSRFSATGHADIGFGYGYGVYQAVVNAPISDNSALRISGHINNVGDIIHNVTDGSKSLDYDWGLRGRFLWEPTDKLTVNLIADYDREKQDNLFLQWDSVPAGSPLEGILTACGVTASRTNRDTCVNRPVYTDTANYGASLQLDYKLGDYTLTSITAERQNTSIGNNDIDITPVDLLANRSDHWTGVLSQEFRLTSPIHQRFEYVVGLYYSDTQVKQNDVGYATAPLLAFGPVVVVPPISSSNLSHADLNSVAVFGQGTVHVSDGLRLILGARETYDDISTDNLDFANNNLFTTGKAHQANFSYKLGFQYDVSHALMFYGTWSRGYKGPQVNLPSTALPGSIVIPEVPVSYELGVKGDILDHRLAVDLNAFYTTVHDFQTQVVTNTPIGPQFVIGNVPKVWTRGVELDVFGHLFPGLSINGGAIYNVATYGHYLAQNIEQLTVDVNGEQLAFTPRWKFNLSGEYAHQVAEGVDGFVAMDGVYKSKINFDAAPDPLTTIDHQFLLGARLGLRSQSGRWGVSIYGRNLLNNFYPANLQVGPLSNFQGGLNGGVPSVAHVLTIDSFRTFGISLDGHF